MFLRGGPLPCPQARAYKRFAGCARSGWVSRSQLPVGGVTHSSPVVDLYGSFTVPVIQPEALCCPLVFKSVARVLSLWHYGAAEPIHTDVFVPFSLSGFMGQNKPSAVEVDIDY